MADNALLGYGRGPANVLADLYDPRMQNALLPARGGGNALAGPSMTMPSSGFVEGERSMVGGAMQPAGTNAGMLAHALDTLNFMGTMKAPAGHVTAYHGGPGTYDWASANTRRGAIQEFNAGPEGAAFFSNRPERAAEYAVGRYPERATTYPVHLDQADMLVHDSAAGWKSNAQLIEEARAAGKATVHVKNAQDTITDGSVMGRIKDLLGRKPYGGPEDVYMVLDPKAIRYPFGGGK